MTEFTAVCPSGTLCLLCQETLAPVWGLSLSNQSVKRGRLRSRSSCMQNVTSVARSGFGECAQRRV